MCSGYCNNGIVLGKFPSEQTVFKFCPWGKVIEQINMQKAISKMLIAIIKAAKKSTSKLIMRIGLMSYG